MASYFDIYIDQGATFSVDLIITGSDGSPLDLTGYSVQGKMSRSFYSSTSVAFTGEVTSAPDGLITLSLSKTATAALWPTRYVYDVSITDGNAVTSRVYEGMATVSPGITAIPKPLSYEQ
jgi:hypothetical protein